MIFQNLLIENFRGIKHLEIKGLNRINLLGGKNNSGKTSVLEVVQFLACPFNSENYANLNLAREYHKEEENIETFFYELDKQNRVLIQDTSSGKTIQIFDQKANTSALSNNSNNVLIKIPDQDDVKFIYYFNGNSYHLPEGKQFIDNLNKNYSTNSIFLHSTQNFLPDLPLQIKKIKIEKEIRKIVEVLNQVDQRIVEIDIFDEVIFVDIGLKRLIPIQLAGDGLKRILSIVVGMYKTRGGIMLIDEVDIGLHYSVQEIMWQAIFKASLDFQVQVFATTHSTDCIMAFAQIAKQNKVNLANYYRLDRHETEHKAVLYEKEMLIDAVSQDFEIR